MAENLKKVFDNAEKVGVIGSPSSTGELTIDVLGTAVNKSLVGSLSVFSFQQDGFENYALGQIVEITMQNIWSQDPTIRGLIRQKGRIDPITERQDTHIAKVTVSSVFANKNSKIEQSLLGTVPSTGTSVKALNEDIMNSLLSDYTDQLFYIGKAYGTEINMPMWFKHFGRDARGAGEAYHIGIFGKTGSGKSVLAKMIMTAYSKNKHMSIFVLDPQGEFSKDFRTDSSLRQSLEQRFGRIVHVYDLHNLILTGYDLFKKVLINSELLERLGIIHEDNRYRAANEIESILKRKGLEKDIPPYYAHERSAFNRVWQALQDPNVLVRIYSTPEPRDRVKNALLNLDTDEIYQLWLRIANLFRYREGQQAIKIKELVTKIHENSENGEISIIDLSGTNTPQDILWNDMVKHVVIGKFIEEITQEAEETFRKNELLNCLVIIDEAHRLAPRFIGDEENKEELVRVRDQLVDAVRTTRKFGLGWMFISQTLSSLSKDIIDQIRIYIFGFGLGWGSEREALLQIIGGQNEAMKLYQLFRDPQSSLSKREYPFMTVGPISPLSFAGTPLFFTGLKYPDEFLSSNSLESKGKTV